MFTDLLARVLQSIQMDSQMKKYIGQGMGKESWKLLVPWEHPTLQRSATVKHSKHHSFTILWRLYYVGMIDSLAIGDQHKLQLFSPHGGGRSTGWKFQPSNYMVGSLASSLYPKAVQAPATSYLLRIQKTLITLEILRVYFLSHSIHQSLLVLVIIPLCLEVIWKNVTSNVGILMTMSLGWLSTGLKICSWLGAHCLSWVTIPNIG